MGEILEVEESGFAGFIEDDTIFRGKVAACKIDEKPWKDDDGNPVKAVSFRVKIIDPGGAHDDGAVWGDTPTTLNSHPECKLRHWAEAALGMELPVGYKLDLDLLLDSDIRVVVGYKEYVKKDGSIGKRNFVKDLMPSREAMAQASRQPVNNSDPF